MWCLTALPKLSIRIGSANPVNPENSQSAIITRIKKNLEEFSSNSNIEIQQRACEFLAILSEGWKDLRVSIFEPMPFKGDENMLVDAKDRAALDADEGDDQLLMGFGDDNAGSKATGNTNAPADGGGLLDLDMMLGGPSDAGASNTNIGGGMQNDLMGLFDAPPQNNAQTANPVGQGGDLFNAVGDMFGSGAQ
jgi:hypothetical protein